MVRHRSRNLMTRNNARALLAILRTIVDLIATLVKMWQSFHR